MENPIETTRTMLTPDDQLRARFVPGNSVSFLYYRKRVHGVILRTHPKRALVLMNDQEFTVPYELLEPDPETAAKNELKIESIAQTAHDLIALHTLKRWTFKLDHGTRRAGSCNFHTQTLTLSFNLAHSGTYEEIRDTLLHEIAHALVGRKHHHDAIWKSKAKEIGCSGKRTHEMRFTPPRWNVSCENNCWTQTAQRRNPRLICRTCNGKLIYRPYVAADHQRNH